MAQKPSIPKGTRDFGPSVMIRRNYIFRIIREVFESFGYQPLETPAMESLDTLLGKYGEEGDRLIFKILNSGDFAGKSGWTELGNEITDTMQLSKKLSGRITGKALRYDLTVPFARYVVQNRNNLTLPFKRYQIQPVWRADRPQRGRYREFYQCDVDVIGSNSLLNETELVQLINQVFKQLNIRVIIKLNNRKILAGLAGMIGRQEQLTELTVAIDKLDKIGMDEVTKELIDRGFSNSDVAQLMPVITSRESFQGKIKLLKELFHNTPVGQEGIQEMETLMKLLDSMEISSSLEFDLSLARGLNYYTGAIIEVQSRDIEIGSICGGGRYDNLTGIFGLPGVSGVGVSFGADRIYDVLNQLHAFPEDTQSLTQVLFLNFGEDEVIYSLPLAEQMRRAGFKTEIYPDPVKIKKQMQYAHHNQIPVVVMYGEEERLQKQITIKQMSSGEQATIVLHNLKDQITQWIE
ncbi:MAG: histidine--tRNA ligase [Bacteroidales bacterium]|nr:histidine--tRNA ligase [Bacteroidales bacterium]